jgi:hypothetical protein
VLTVDVAALLSVWHVIVVHSHLAGQDVTDHNLVFSLDEGCHSQLDEWERIDAELLLLVNFIDVLLSAENSFYMLKSLLWLHHAVVEESFSIESSLHLTAANSVKEWELLVSVFVNPASLHEIL